MKRIILIAALMLTTLAGFAQEGVKDIYAKYSKIKGATSVYISPSMFNLIGNIATDEMLMDDDIKEILPLVRNMEGLYLIDCEDTDTSAKMFEDALKYVKSSKMELMMEVNDDGDHIKLYTCSDKDVVRDLLFLVEDGTEFTMINILGEISQKELSDYIIRMSKN